MLRGKRALVVGVANARSIAWAIADRWRREGAEVFITYQQWGQRLCRIQPRLRHCGKAASPEVLQSAVNRFANIRKSERFRGPVERLVREQWGPFDAAASDGASTIPAAPCDLSNEGEIAVLFRILQDRGFCSSQPQVPGDGTSLSDGGEDGDRVRGTGTTRVPKIDAILHSVAHAPTEAMQGVSFLTGTTRDAFVSAHVVSAYSLVSTVRQALPYLAPRSSIVALSYIGSQRAAKNYNVMGPAKASLESCARALGQELGSPTNGGIRVNCLSPGPLRTMAARGISGFDEMRREAAERSPLQRNAGVDEIAGAATFLVSPLASCVTGQIIYADGGFSSVI